MARYDTVSDAFEAISDEYSGWEKRRDRHREMFTVLQQFGPSTVAEYLVEESGECPVCGVPTDGTNVRNLKEPVDDSTPNLAPIPYVICDGDCLDPLNHTESNRWLPLRNEWEVTDLESRAREMVAGLVTDHAGDIKRVYTSGTQAELALSEDERAAIHERLDEVIAIAEGSFDGGVSAERISE